MARRAVARVHDIARIAAASLVILATATELSAGAEDGNRPVLKRKAAIAILCRVDGARTGKP